MKKPTLKSLFFALFLTATCAPYIYTLDAAFADQDCVNCEAVRPKKGGLFSRLVGFLKGGPKREHQRDEAPVGERRQMCEELQVGDYRRYNKAIPGGADWYRTGNYTIRKVTADRYQAILNLDFDAEPGTKVGAIEMKDRFQRCMQAAAPLMKGPGGETLEVVVMSPNEMDSLPRDQRPVKSQIIIHKPGTQYQENARDFDENASCTTITHELMHHLGLVDEYRERRNDHPVKEWNCRVVTKAPSIMRDMVGMYNMVKAKSVSCDCSTVECKAMSSGLYPNAQKIFLGKTTRLLINGDVQRQYCSTGTPLPNLVETQSLDSPDRSVVTLENSNGNYRFESRRISSAMWQGQKYSISRYETKCQCPSGDSDCTKIFDEIVSKVNTESLVSDECPELVGPPKEGLVASDVLTIATPAPEKSLLQPSQFQKIIHGTCERPDTAVMLRCEKFAYTGKPDPKDCRIPPECNDDRQLLGIPQ